MSTSLLYHAFGIRGYHYTRTDDQGGEVIFIISQEPKSCHCSACGSARVVSRGHVERRGRDTGQPNDRLVGGCHTPPPGRWSPPPS